MEENNINPEKIIQEQVKPIQNGYFLPLIIFSLLLIVFIIAGGIYYFKILKNKTIVTENNTQQDVISELEDFPLYPGSILTHKSATSYSYKINDSFANVYDWYFNKQTIWKCSGGAGSIDDPQHSAGGIVTSCKKGVLNYPLHIIGDTKAVTISIEILNIAQYETANWKTYQNEDIIFNYPSQWVKKPILMQGSGLTQAFEDPELKFSLTFSSSGNYNQVTGKPYTNIDEFINMPYQVKTVIIDGQDGRQPLPRAGSENVNSTMFFSKDSKFIYTIELKTGKTALDVSGADINDGQKLFDQILSTFKFIGQNDDKIKSLEFDNGCMVKITFISKREITLNPNTREEKCSPGYLPKISPNGHYGAVELRLLKQFPNDATLGAANSVFVYFADQEQWILVDSFGAATVSNLTFDTDNNLLITLFYEGKVFGTKKILLPEIAEKFDKTVNSQTRELNWQYSDLYIIQ